MAAASIPTGKEEKKVKPVSEPEITTDEITDPAVAALFSEMCKRAKMDIMAKSDEVMIKQVIYLKKMAEFLERHVPNPADFIKYLGRNCTIAGGAVLSAMTNNFDSPRVDSDIDIFTTDTKILKFMIDNNYSIVGSRNIKTEKYNIVGYIDSVITFAPPKNQKHYLPVQVITVKKEFKDNIMSFIELDFDLDFCRASYSGQLIENYDAKKKTAVVDLVHLAKIRNITRENDLRSFTNRTLERAAKYIERGYTVKFHEVHRDDNGEECSDNHNESIQNIITYMTEGGIYDHIYENNIIRAKKV